MKSENSFYENISISVIIIYKFFIYVVLIIIGDFFLVIRVGIVYVGCTISLFFKWLRWE